MTLLVTGASSDMGTALIEYVAEKYDVIIAHYCHMNDQLQELKNKLGSKMILLQADLSAEDDVDHFISELSDISPAPCHLVHFPAQRIKVQKFIKTGWDDFDSNFAISIRSLVLVLQGLIPRMIKEKHGRIVIMLSDAIVGVPPKYSADYVTTKYALLGLTKSLSVEYADKGITVNGVSPSFTETKFVDGLADFFREEHRNSSPIGRNLVPEDIIPTIAMLLSDAASCINGQNIPINCGG